MPPRKRKPALAPIIEQETVEADPPLAESAVEQGQQEQNPNSEELAALVQAKIREVDRIVAQKCQAILAAAQDIVADITDAIKIELLKLPKQAKETPLEAYLAQGGTAQVSMQALRDRVDTMLQQGGMDAATALATTRTTRSRAAAGSGATTAAEPAAARTTRRGKATAGAAADNMQNMPPATVVGKQAAIRKAQKGEVLYSVNGSPVVLGGAGPLAAAAAAAALPGPSKLATPAVPQPPAWLTAAAAPPATMGAFTLVKKEPAPRRGRGRQRKQAEPEAETAIMITTQDGSQFMMDGSGTGSIPEQYRAEVQQQLETLQKLTAMALGGKLI